MLDRILTVLGISMFVYHMVGTHYLLAGAYEHQTIHLFFILSLTFLNGLRKRQGSGARLLQVGLVGLSVFVTGYIFFNLVHLEEVAGFPDTIDVVIGVLLIILVIEGTRQAWGMTLPIVVFLFLSYFFFGHHLAGFLHHEQFPFGYVISYLGIGLSGIFGVFLSVSANQIFLFIVFGSLMELIKITDFFFELGKITGRYLQGGPSQTAVVSSCLVGMVTGAAVANVAITGAYTIPYMKRIGYKPEIAGAIEATASTGGQIMPPIMGASAFVMAFLLGVPYATIMVAGLLPAFLYFLSVAFGVQFLAVSQNIFTPSSNINKRMIFSRLPLFVIPLMVIIFLLFQRFSPNYAAFWAIILAILLSCLRKETRPTLVGLMKNLSHGAMMGAQVGISLAIVGLMAQTIITTGLGVKITALITTFSEGNLIISLLLIMVLCIILGCGIPTVAAYSLVALIAVPSLIEMGVMPLSAHFFAFYFAVISALTPPVALAALAGAGIAKAGYFRTSIQAFKLAIAGFIIPFFIVYNPILVLQVTDWVWAVGSLVTIPVALLTLSASIYNHGLTKFTPLERMLSIITSVLMFGYSIFRHVEKFPFEYPMMILGSILFLVLLKLQFKKRARMAAQSDSQLHHMTKG